MTAESMIDYEALAQEAMRSVVRNVLSETAAKGLPGEHHFYISFDTLAPGVILSKRLREKYAEEMTIVLQHRFWDLIVNDHRFEVKLTFDGIPERLVVPFKAIRVFFDPSVRYGLQFETVAMQASNEVHEDGQGSFDDPFADRDFSSPGLVHTPRSRGRHMRGPGPVDGDGDLAAPPRRRRRKTDERREVADPAANAEAGDQVDEDVAEIDEGEASGAEIVSLDAFRKK